jgi:predicted HD phosphohydrolase
MDVLKVTERASFTAMEHATAKDYEIIGRACTRLEQMTPVFMRQHLLNLRGMDFAEPLPPFEHSLQTATRAMRAGADDETVIMALFHDVGAYWSEFNHGEAAALLLRPFISDDNYWIIKHHDVFQGYYFWHYIGGDRNSRDRYQNHPLFERTRNFCHLYDQNSFDVKYDTLPLDAFEPLIKTFFSKAPREVFAGDTHDR